MHPILLLREFNLWEALLWGILGMIVLFRPLPTGWKPLQRNLLVIALFAFGGSDLMEMKTGAWWKPWWLFVWKAGCVATFLALYWMHRRKRKSSEAESPNEEVK